MRQLAFLFSFLLLTACLAVDKDEGTSSSRNDTTSAADTSGGTETVEEADTAPPDAAPEETIEDAVDATPCVPECEQIGYRQCSGENAVWTCELKDGCLGWGIPVPCPAGLTCLDAVCVDTTDECAAVPGVCPTVGALRCGAGNSVEECVAGDCATWQVIEMCASNQTCEDGECVQQLDPSECLPLDECRNTHCADPAVTASEVKLQRCTLQHCVNEYEDCVGPFGDAACKDILKCAQSCTTQDCQADCLAAGSFDGSLQFLDLGVCLEDFCPAALTDPMGNLSCITGQCGTEMNTCCGGSILGCM
jgi:hypothetical protein